MSANVADLTPIPLTIKVVRSVTRRMQLTLTANGSAVDLTGATVRLTVKRHPSQAEGVVYTVDAVSSAPLTGVTVLTIPKTETFGTDGQTTHYRHEIRLIQSNGEEVVWWSGDFSVDPTPAP